MYPMGLLVHNHARPCSCSDFQEFLARVTQILRILDRVQLGCSAKSMNHVRTLRVFQDAHNVFSDLFCGILAGELPESARAPGI